MIKFKSVKSTSEEAHKLIKKDLVTPTLITAENQTKGRGTMGKKWISSKGNLFISFFNELNQTNLSINGITKINCLLVKKLLSFYYKKKIIFKKPNDLLIDKKKICGILQEKISKLNKMYLIVGIGINLISSPNVSEYKTTSVSEFSNDKNPLKIFLQISKQIDSSLPELKNKKL